MTLVLFARQEAFGFEYFWVFVDARVVKEPPYCRDENRIFRDAVAFVHRFRRGGVRESERADGPPAEEFFDQSVDVGCACAVLGEVWKAKRSFVCVCVSGGGERVDFRLRLCLHSRKEQHSEGECA